MTDKRIRIMIATVLLSGGILIATAIDPNFWSAPDQRGQKFFNDGEFDKAAREFVDPSWQGTAWFRAGNFKDAEKAFARSKSPASIFNRANALVFLGKYDAAIEQYDLLLATNPDWEVARTNRAVAVARAEAVKQSGGDAGDQRIGADEIVFDKDGQSGGQDTDVEQGEELSDAGFQATWLKRVQTKPAEFLKAKFAYQHQFGNQSEDEND